VIRVRIKVGSEVNMDGGPLMPRFSNKSSQVQPKHVGSYYYWPGMQHYITEYVLSGDNLPSLYSYYNCLASLLWICV
jgi:hypothetical protein